MIAKTKDVLTAALGQRWDETRTQLKTCRHAFSEEAVHDLRVSARRLLAVFDIIRAIDPQPRVQNIRRLLKDQLDDLDELRDVQVMLVEAGESLEQMPGLGPFQTYLQKREKRLLRLARKDIQVWRPSETGRRIEKMRVVLEKQARNPKFRERILHAVDSAFLRAAQAYGQMDSTQAATIHRLRIAFKKFRYMAEIVLSLLPASPGSYLEGMHDYQSAMGDIQDTMILLNTLAEFVEKEGAATHPESIRRHYERRHAALVTAYVEDKAELLTFWRPAPDKPFPWEKSDEPLHNPSHRSQRRQGPTARKKRTASVR